MAHTTQTITAPASTQVFAGIPPNIASNQIYPRARLTFRNATTITAKGAGDTKGVELSMTLPANFAYVVSCGFAMITCSSSQTDPDHYENLSRFIVQEDTPVSFDFADMQLKSQGLMQTSASSITPGGKIWDIVKPFGEIFYNQGGNTPRCFAHFIDSDAVNATATCVLTYNYSFLQYDIEQALNVAVNAPMPVATR